jgi:hypothetical protein
VSSKIKNQQNKPMKTTKSLNHTASSLVDPGFSTTGHTLKQFLTISIAGILALSAPGMAKAQLSFTATVGGVPSVSDATLDNLDEPSPSILTLSGNAYLITGNFPQTAPPYFSGSTAAYFGESPTTGLDASQFVGVEPGGSATFNFSTSQNYFGILWGSVDGGNTLTFYNSLNNVIGSINGTDIPGAPLDFQNNPDETFYVNITSTTPFSKVVATSSVYSFEFDDIAYAEVVPEPAGTVLFGAGLFILGFVMRRKSA